jgi:hypothetical protein
MTSPSIKRIFSSYTRAVATSQIPSDRVPQLLVNFHLVLISGSRIPIDSIVIHLRSSFQIYSGRLDLGAYECCLSLTRHRVIYNGDIVSKASFDKPRALFPQIKTWMIGRGVMTDPALPIY